MYGDVCTYCTISGNNKDSFLEHPYISGSNIQIAIDNSSVNCDGNL